MGADAKVSDSPRPPSVAMLTKPDTGGSPSVGIVLENGPRQTAELMRAGGVPCVLGGHADHTAGTTSLIVVQHWGEELKRLVPTK